MIMSTIIANALTIPRMKDRFAYLRANGLSIAVRPMGSGGVGQVKKAAGETRTQVSAGWGRFNYAYVVIS